ncbi:MAG: tyrosine-type recombinase/integrase, partial [Deltaproteobacteria bacterium]|nr:tyrosine-type recombinase/integrase [Deltaproteobacteria bacterium]
MDSKNQDYKKSADIKRFWDHYIQILLSKKIHKNAVRWYVIRVEQYLEIHTNKKLIEHNTQDVEAYFQKIGRNKHLLSWQFYQVIHAIQIFFEDFLKTDWAKTFKWEFLINSAKQLENGQPTVVRSYSSKEGPETTPYNSPKDETLSPGDLELLEKVRSEIRRRHYSIRTEQSYEAWLRRFIGFNINKSLKEMGSPEVISFLEYLSVKRHVAASTQNQALNAIIFLYDQVLKKPLGDIGTFVRAKRPHRLPVVLSRSEVASLLIELKDEVFGLMAGLLYGTGMRLMECIRLRVQDIDFDYNTILV